jgi:hypothetical protein
LWLNDYISSLGGDSVFERDGVYYVGEYDPETETVFPVLADDNSGEYIAITPHIVDAVYLENYALGEAPNKVYADAVLVELSRKAADTK